jgi:glutaredoxin 3
MATKRTIEIFSAGCPACEEAVTLVNQLACPSWVLSLDSVYERAMK